MKAVRSVSAFRSRIGIARELIGFLWRRKLWWMIPMVVTLLGVAFLMIFTEGTAIAPFIYTLF